jgi:predicted DNA-binding transcriptional regulator AlpA
MITELLTEKAVAQQYSLSLPWLRKARSQRRGPKFIRVSRMVRYWRSDIEAFLMECQVELKHERTR